jgi:hypothetical protein
VTSGEAIEPRVWTLVFCKSATSKWVQRLVPGKYKHVRAYAYLPAAKAWLFYDVTMIGTSIRLAPDTDETVRTIIYPFTKDADLLSIKHQGPTRWPPLFGFCVPAIKHLIGLNSGALLVDAFFRDCLRAGAMRLGDDSGQPSAVHSASAGPCVCDPAGAD